MTARHAIALPLVIVFLAMTGCALPSAPDRVPREFLLSADFPAAESVDAGGPVLVVGRPRASAGFDTARMVYVEEPHALNAFANNRWADAPADMLAPLVVEALEATGAYAAVVDTGSGVGADFRLDTEVIRLQHEFLDATSSVRLAVRATLVDLGDGSVALARTYEERIEAPGNDPASGVRAANRAVESLLRRLAADAAAAGRAD